MKPLYRTLIIYCIVILGVIFSAYLIQIANGTPFRYEYQQAQNASLDKELALDLSNPNMSLEDIEVSNEYNKMVKDAVATKVVPVSFIERFTLSWDGIDLTFIKWIVFILIMLLPITVVGLYHTSESVILGMLIAFTMLATSWLATSMNWYVFPSSSGWFFPSSTSVSYVFVIIMLLSEAPIVANVVKIELKRQESIENQNIPLEQEVVINTGMTQFIKMVGKLIIIITILISCATCVFWGGLWILNRTANKTMNEAINKERQANPYRENEYESIYAAGRAIDAYFEQHGTYSGFELTDLMTASIQTDDCNTKIILDISPDGSEYVLHRPFCGNLEESDCLENGSSIGLVSDTATIERTFHCI